jgi:hypothetical protein
MINSPSAGHVSKPLAGRGSPYKPRPFPSAGPTVPGQHVIVTDWRFSGIRSGRASGHLAVSARADIPEKNEKLVDRTFSEWDKARMFTQLQQRNTPPRQAARKAEPLVNGVALPAVSALLLGLIIIPDRSGVA